MPSDQPDSLGEAVPASTSPAPDAAPAPPARKKHKAKIEHRIPGRIRMKVPHAHTDPEILEVYRQAFQGVPGITLVKARPESGSIVIHYDPAREQEVEHHFQHACDQHLAVAEGARPGDEVAEMARQIEAEADFLASRSEIARFTVDFFKGFDRELKLATDNNVDLKIVLAGGLAAFTFLEIGAEAATPMWVTLALFSLNHFAELHSEAAAAASGVRRA